MRGNRNGGRGRGRGRAWQENRGRKEQNEVGRSTQTEEAAVSKGTTDNSSVCEEPNTDHLEPVSHLPCADRKVGDNGQSSPVESSCNALGSIVASYSSDNDNDDNIPATEPHECALNNRNKVHGITAQKASTRPDRRKRVAKQQRQEMKKLTLLEKLLAADIRHERNIILQCVRYIARHHFFNEKLGDTPGESAPKTQKLHEQIV
ncbi:hypothetical protein LSAT2_029247 [Lamellibrachia satsuma]|nr:hypothetical protein LSAT2_029247 [Lamellibrachia satsuma]